MQTLSDYGIATLLDFHQDSYSATFSGNGAPAWATQTGGLPNFDVGFPLNYLLNPAANHAWDAFWTNATAPNGLGLEDNYAAMAEHVASYFRASPNVIGYDLMNEPWPGTPWLSSLLGSAFFDRQKLTPFYNQIASAIRAVDPSTPLFYEPAPIFDYGFPTRLGTVEQPGTVFSFHAYCVLAALCSLEAGTTVKHAANYSRTQAMPAVLTEFGNTNNFGILNDTMRSANQATMGWTEWEYTAVGDITSAVEWLVKDPAKPPVGNNVNTPKLKVLAQPYPQLISGIPNSWKVHDGTFQLSYSTRRAGGLGSFAPGSLSKISVPEVRYPNGYQVTVSGGTVVSGTNAPTLLIAADAGTVTVTAAPMT